MDWVRRDLKDLSDKNHKNIINVLLTFGRNYPFLTVVVSPHYPNSETEGVNALNTLISRKDPNTCSFVSRKKKSQLWYFFMCIQKNIDSIIEFFLTPG